jgi:hypothetical protein
VQFNDYIALAEPGLYVAQVKFFPDLFVAENSPFIASNKLTFNIRPAAENPAERSMVEAEIDKAAQRESLSPDATIAYLLNARMIDQWAKFFLYINLSELYINSYLQNDQARDQFNRLSETDKKTKVEIYRNQILAGKAEWYLVLRPTKFEVKETKYSPNLATVKVVQSYQHPDYMEPREYVYSLKRTDGIWEIINYKVTNQNTGTR